MVYKLATGALVAVGLFLLAMGVQRWLDQRSAARVANAFMTAVEQGNREAVLSLLLPTVRARIESTAHPKQQASHSPARKHRASRGPAQPQTTTGRTVENPDGDIPLLTADPGTTHRIHHVTIRGDQAIVEFRIEKHGFVSKPVLHLARSKTSHWKIESIENGQVDPLWLDLQNHRAQVIGRQTAAELDKALSHRPGVSVERTEPDDTGKRNVSAPRP